MPPKRSKAAVKDAMADCILPPEDAMADSILPPEMMLCILSRLPVKSLMRFKSVCKPWHQLVSNPKFIKIHYEQFSRGHKICSVKFHTLSNLIMGHSDPNEVFLTSCRGLVCVARPLVSREIVLWNPATNLWKTLPHSKAEFAKSDWSLLGFGCNADDAVGGYDYKVVRLLQWLEENPRRAIVEVYSSKTDSWKWKPIQLDIYVFAIGKSAIVNGTPYWNAWIREKTEVGKDFRKVMLGFDFTNTNMEFKIVPMPNLNLEEVRFVEWEGSLGGIVCMKDADGWLKSIDVWVYDDGASVWTRKESYGGFKMQVDELINVSRGGKIFGSCLNHKFFIYNTVINRVSIVDPKGDWWDPSKIFPYEECLAYVQGMKPMEACKEDCRDENINNIDGFFVSSSNNPLAKDIRNNPLAKDIRCRYALGC